MTQVAIPLRTRQPVRRNPVVSQAVILLRIQQPVRRNLAVSQAVTLLQIQRRVQRSPAVSQVVIPVRIQQPVRRNLVVNQVATPVRVPPVQKKYWEPMREIVVRRLAQSHLAANKHLRLQNDIPRPIWNQINYFSHF